MIYLSKSKYCGLWQCPKIAWLKKYKPEGIEVSFDYKGLCCTVDILKKENGGFAIYEVKSSAK